MRLISKRLAPLLIAIAAGCAGQAYVISDPPPPPRYETVAYRPGFIYVHGNWNRVGHRWVWHDGYYERERPGYVYAHGRWDRRGDRYVWVNGGWHARGRVVVRRY